MTLKKKLFIIKKEEPFLTNKQNVGTLDTITRGLNHWYPMVIVLSKSMLKRLTLHLWFVNA